MTSNNTVLRARCPGEWRAWLAEYGQSQPEVWLVIPHRGSGAPGLSYEQAVEHALCFGWIDGLHCKHDAGSSRLRFTPRRLRSMWSAINRTRAANMITCGLMTAAGQNAIDHAKAIGTWQSPPAQY